MIIKVDTTTVFNWEAHTSTPSLHAWPAVLEFLGYDPRPEGQTVGQKLRRQREGLGLTLDQVAEVMGVDPATVNKWEHFPDERQNYASITKITSFLGFNPLPAPATPGERVRQARLLMGLTQRQLAERLSVCQRMVSKWEHDQVVPSAAVTDQVSRLFQ